MNHLIKKMLCIPFILLGLFHQNLYAFDCDTSYSNYLWTVSWTPITVNVSETDGERTPLKSEAGKKDVASGCKLKSAPDTYTVTIKMLLPSTRPGLYQLPNGIELDMSMDWQAKLVHDDGKKETLALTLDPDVEYTFSTDTIKKAGFKIQAHGFFVYHNSDGRLKSGYFKEQIGEVIIENGPSLPIFIQGDLGVQHAACSVTDTNSPIVMPNISAQSFNHGINTPAGPKVPVTVDVKCTEDIPDVFIHLDESRASNAQQGILAPDPSSTTEGIAIQLLDAQDNPIDITQNIKSITSDNRLHRISMQARYFQTSLRIRAGLLRSSTSFSLVYQ